MKTLRPRPFWAGIVAIALAIAVARQIISIGAAQQMLGMPARSMAYGVRPENARAAAYAAEQALTLGDVSKAAELARGALRQSPIDVVALRTLGQALNAQKSGMGDHALTLAAELSWRDSPTQLWLIDRAVRAGELRIAFERAEALARQARNYELTFTMLRLIAQDPNGRAMLVRSLAENPFWRNSFFYIGVPQAAPAQLQAMAQVLRDLQGTRAAPTKAEARATINALFTTGQQSAALQLYQRMVSNRPKPVIVDPGFDHAEANYQGTGAATVFDWQVSDLAGATAAVEKDPDNSKNRVLYGSGDGNATGAIMTQALILAPGSYTLRYRMRVDDPAAGPIIGFQIRCSDSPLPLAPRNAGTIAPGRWTEREYRFSVPASGCTAQSIELDTAADPAARNREAWFDDLRLSRVE